MKPRTAQLAPAVLQMYPAKTIRRIAAATKLSYGTVWRILNEAGIRMEPRGGAPRERRK